MDRKTLIQSTEFGNRSEAYEAFDDIPLSPTPSHPQDRAQDHTGTIGDAITARYGRRDILGGLLGTSASAALFSGLAMVAPHQANAASRYVFEELQWGNDETHHIADGYNADILLRWGDPILPGAPPFDVNAQTAQAQLGQFGYNNDYVGFVPLNAEGTRGLLCVNHEYTNEEMMFPALPRQDRADFRDMTRALVDIEMAAHGGSIVEISRETGPWQVIRDSRYNRRITPLSTEMTVSGPAAGNKRLQTHADPTGRRIIGTINNCAGGMTPWGTWLMAEENTHGYFWSDNLDDDNHPDLSGRDDAQSLRRYGIPGRWNGWGRFHDRFNIDLEPNEPYRFGWIVEVDPLDPTSTPIKHTALGRFRHEGAETIVSKHGHLVIYCGDDSRFEYLYKYVSDGVVSDDRGQNSQLLSDGTLYVARFDDDGGVDWLPLVHGTGPLTVANGFADQADVLIDARLAADLLGATPMDRPEDVQPRGDGTVYVMLTNNSSRQTNQTNAANPRAKSRFGHIIEIKEANNDHAAQHGHWSILVKCGDPSIAKVGAQWNPDTSDDGWFAAPDNCAFDADGRLWIATDQGSRWNRTGKSDGLYALETEGAARATSRLFFRSPVGGEVCGPCFTQDGETLFLAVQHPGTDGTKALKGFNRASTFYDPATRWPDFDPDMPPRPSIVVVTKKGGGKIAG